MPIDHYGNPFPGPAFSRRGDREDYPSRHSGGGRGGGRYDDRDRDYGRDRDRDFIRDSPPRGGRFGTGRGRGGRRGERGGRGEERGGRGRPRPDEPWGNKRPRYDDDMPDDHDYERFIGTPMHEGHEAFSGPPPPRRRRDGGPPSSPERRRGPGLEGRGRGRGGGGYDDRRGEHMLLDEPGFPLPHGRGGGGGRGHRGDIPGPGGRGPRRDGPGHEGPWDGEPPGRGGGGRGRGRGGGGGRGSRERPLRGGLFDGGGRGGGGRGYRREEAPDHPEYRYWEEDPLSPPPPRQGARRGEWDEGGRGRPRPEADLLNPEWEPDPRFDPDGGGGGRGAWGGGRGGRGRGGRGGSGRGGRGEGGGRYRPRGGEPPSPGAGPVDRDWGSQDRGEDGGEWGGRGPPPVDGGADGGGGSGFREWSAFDDSPPRAPPPRGAPMSGRPLPPGGRGHRGNGPGPRGGGMGRGLEPPPPGSAVLGMDPVDRRLPAHTEHLGGGGSVEGPPSGRRRQVNEVDNGCRELYFVIWASFQGNELMRELHLRTVQPVP